MNGPGIWERELGLSLALAEGCKAVDCFLKDVLADFKCLFSA